MNYSHKSHILIVVLFGVSTLYFTDSYSIASSEVWKNICERVAGGREVKFTGTRAEFFDGKYTWTIFGATQNDTEIINKPTKWSVKSNSYQILTVNEPISDIAILPFSDPVPNTSSDITLRLSAWRGEFEPASIVLRSSNLSLNQVTIDASNFSHIDNNSLIDRNNIDIRVVKCWYQAGIDLLRKPGDKKRLVPEILLHDTDLIRVDHEHNVNLVKNIRYLKDAITLQSFDLPPFFNQQIWITVYAPLSCKPGLYTGRITVRFDIDGRKNVVNIPIRLNVDKRAIPETPYEFALYYLANYDNTDKVNTYQGSKNKKQLYAELKDMKDHGLTNVAILYRYIKRSDGKPNFDKLIPVLEAMRQAGFNTNKLLFLDWVMGGSDDKHEYINKMLELKHIASERGFAQVYVYNKDESEVPIMKLNMNSFNVPHLLGFKNFVACKASVASKLEGLLDVAILPRNSDIKGLFCNNEADVSCVKITPWAYNDPQAGMEMPGTYRKKYGASLIKDGFRGICNYAYQSGSCWDDWAESRYRPHVMAYPTIDLPLPTLQWEGFREGLDDIKKELFQQ